jgi:hypothetical protein
MLSNSHGSMRLSDLLNEWKKNTQN